MGSKEQDYRTIGMWIWLLLILASVDLTTSDNTTSASISSGDESCYVERETAGCSWHNCSSLVCEKLPSCCDTEKGAWNYLCVDLAAEHCSTLSPYLGEIIETQDPVIYGRDPFSPCPTGFTCEGNKMSSCSDIREAAIDDLVGDIYAGTYCPYGEEHILNCDIGYYCPDPSTEIPCPAGYFCPYKSSVPDEFKCFSCEEAATFHKRDTYGFVLIWVLAIPSFLYIVFFLYRKNNKEFAEKVKGMQQRQSDQLMFMKRKRKNKEQLERLRPKLDLITRRLEKIMETEYTDHDLLDGNSEHSSADSYSSGQQRRRGSGSGRSSGRSSIGHSSHGQRSSLRSSGHKQASIRMSGIFGGFSSSRQSSSNVRSSVVMDAGIAKITEKGVTFDSSKFFDAIDVDDSGDASYDELNAVLELNPVELSEFVRRMNDLDGEQPETTTVTRATFVKYFLQVLEETSRLTCSRSEAGELFDEIAELSGTNRNGEIDEDSLYESSMADFLSDAQIHYIVKKFRNTDSPASKASKIESFKMNKSSTSQSDLFRGAKNVMQRAKGINRDEFVEHYPRLLIAATVDDLAAGEDEEELKPSSFGIDIAFEHLELKVSVGDKSFNVVDDVTGRVKSGTMTALMGGSGAGKTSLLNALCGRAYYGEVHGKIFVNGNLEPIEEHKDSIGFVPQDDIVYAELTVRENLMYSGKFRLPRGTPKREIKDLADETMANLGLSRIARTIVGDVKRRGVSGGEKKRVNIGLELMARPKAIFLDEPTSGLDASSALLVMKSLRHLVEKQRVTICSVIHQPRKFIFDLFDSVVLLGVGGRMVYHGTTEHALEYFEKLNYRLPPGESVADWLIDISSGRLAPGELKPKKRKRKKRRKKPRGGPNERGMNRMASTESMGMDSVVEDDLLQQSFLTREESVEDPDQYVGEAVEDDTDEEDGPVNKRGTQYADVIGSKGVSTGKADKAIEEAKARREWLYQEWNKHFYNIDDRDHYEAPLQFELPEKVNKPLFMRQLYYQIAREFLVQWRNRFSKLVDTAVLVGAVFFITLFAGVAEVTTDSQPDLGFEEVVGAAHGNIIFTIFPKLFSFALSPTYFQYALQVGVISGVMLGLLTSKIVTEKRIEFFREAGSGYDVNAYYLAINIVATIMHSAQVIIAAFFAHWLRNSFASFGSFLLHFLILCWLCVSWGLVISLLCPPENVVLVVGFYMSFTGFLLSGATAPAEYKEMYEQHGLIELVAGFLSPTRYFIEAISVGEMRSFPTQTGFTIQENATMFADNKEYSSFGMLGIAMNDLNVVTEQSFDGWYGTVLAAFCVGLTVRVLGLGVIHSSSRTHQIKRPIMTDIKHHRRLRILSMIYLAVLFFMIVTSSLLILRKNS